LEKEPKRKREKKKGESQKRVLDAGKFSCHGRRAVHHKQNPFSLAWEEDGKKNETGDTARQTKNGGENIVDYYKNK